MGRDKARLPIKGKALCEIMAETLRAAGCDPVLISGPGGIKDIYPGQGPLAGIHAAFDHLGKAEAMVIVPVDMPALSAQSLKALIEADGEAVLYGGLSLPLKLANIPHIRQRLEAILSQDGGDWSIRNFVHGLKARPLDATGISARELVNLNTPDDVKTLEQAHET
jgi:molybdopterin-guanine dinucleotide biosynthesis protein A